MPAETRTDQEMRIRDRPGFIQRVVSSEQQERQNTDQERQYHVVLDAGVFHHDLRHVNPSAAMSGTDILEQRREAGYGQNRIFRQRRKISHIDPTRAFATGEFTIAI
jgi:hypothetical protein